MNTIDRIGKAIGDARLDYLSYYAPSWARNVDAAALTSHSVTEAAAAVPSKQPALACLTSFREDRARNATSRAHPLARAAA